MKSSRVDIAGKVEAEEQIEVKRTIKEKSKFYKFCQDISDEELKTLDFDEIEINNFL